MSQSLRDRVEDAVVEALAPVWDAPGPVTMHEAAHLITAAVFAAMSGARPCVTCGRGIGPAKVAKGYVQCYDCTRRRPPVA